MSIQAHRCNQDNCNGFILAENADYNYEYAMKNNNGILDRCKCTECGKEFVMVAAHVLVEVDEDDMLVDELPQCDIREYEKSQIRK